jgi:hypothetical protein
MQLFALYLGGRAPKSTIEVHDVVFCVAKNIEEAYPIAKEKWWGLKNQVHIDSYIELTQIDGHTIELMQEPSGESKKLFFLYFGGYGEHLFGEIHQGAFFIGEDQEEVIKRGQESLCQGLFQQHLDSCIDVETLLTLDEIDGFYLHFIPSPEAPISRPIPGYHFLSCL